MDRCIDIVVGYGEAYYEHIAAVQLYFGRSFIRTKVYKSLKSSKK